MNTTHSPKKDLSVNGSGKPESSLSPGASLTVTPYYTIESGVTGSQTITTTVA